MDILMHSNNLPTGKSRPSGGTGIGRIAGFLLALALVGPPLSAPAQPSAAKETGIKAAHLVKFTQYTAWPAGTFASKEAPIVIGVLGQDPLGEDLAREARGFGGSHPIEIRRVLTVEEAAGCHVVFIPEQESRNEAQWLATLNGRPILTVGESDRSITYGAVMRFVVQKNRVRFEASQVAAARNRLVLNERMLAVASKVYKRLPDN